MPRTARHLDFLAGAVMLLAVASSGRAHADAVASQVSAPTATVADEIADILGEPDSLLGVLTAEVPELRAAFETRLRDTAEREGVIGLRDEGFRIGWEYGQRYTPRFAEKADGDALVGFLTALKAIVIKMDGAGGTRCYDWMFGGEPLDLSPTGITIEDVKAVNDAMAAVISTGARKTATSLAKASDTLVSQVATRAYASAKGYEAGWALLSNPHKPGDDRSKVAACKDVAALYGEILALPKPDAIAVTRVLFTTNKTPQ
jgi:hypothetical protein